MGNFGLTIEQRHKRSISRFDQQSDSIAQSLRVMLPAIVTKFDVDTLTVSVQIACNEYVLLNQPASGTPNTINLITQSQPLPELQDVPIQFPRGGGWNLTLPIKVGDECMVSLADTAIDPWFQNGGSNNNPISQRRHSLSDAIAIFGLCSTPKQEDLVGYSTTDAELRSDDGSVKISLATTGITITAPKVSVNTTGDVDITAGGNMSVTATGVIGILSNGGDTTIDGVPFTPHYHDGVFTGTADTGPVVGP